MAQAEAAGAVVAIGVFDGVHAGHQALIRSAAESAQAEGRPLVAVTFDPDPMSVLIGPGVVPYLTTVDRRTALLLEAGASSVHVLDFDEELQLTPPEDFVRRHLVDTLDARTVVVGPDFQYGYRASGTVSTLREAGARHGFDVIAVDMLGDGTDRWSATRIRSLVADGAVAQAAVGLTRPHGLEGVVVHGDRRGRELGFPTANLSWAGHPAIPADGVYAGFLVTADERMPAAISVGTNPHFDGRERRVESFAIDRTGLDLYGKAVRVDFLERLRGQQAFASLDDLVAAMANDVTQARELAARDLAARDLAARDLAAPDLAEGGERA